MRTRAMSKKLKRSDDNDDNNKELNINNKKRKCNKKNTQVISPNFKKKVIISQGNNEEDIDEHGNIKNLISYSNENSNENSDDEDFEINIKTIENDNFEIDETDETDIHNAIKTIAKAAIDRIILEDIDDEYDSDYDPDENEEEKEYIKKMSIDDQNKLKIIDQQIKEYNNEDEIPPKIKIKLSSMSIPTKISALSKLNILEHMDSSSSEYYKIKNWYDGLIKVPFGVYHQLPINKEDSTENICNFLKTIQNNLNSAVYGHERAKNDIIQIVSQWITNPSSTNKVLALQGPPGTGKTSLIKDGVAKALNRPFSFITLGGATDGSYLEGHSYTWEGSMCGRIISILKETKCMNPVIYFDEVDKISQTHHGKEIVGILTHLTDTSQNNEFHDKYYSGVDFDLSKALFIFSFNDENNVDPILKDRMTIVKIKEFKINEKIEISEKYIIPKTLNNIGFKQEDIIFNSEIIKYIINKCPQEGGVRGLKKAFETIIMKLNVIRLTNESISLPYKINNFKLPFTITNDVVNKLIDEKELNEKLTMMYI